MPDVFSIGCCLSGMNARPTKLKPWVVPLCRQQNMCGFEQAVAGAQAA